MRIIRGTVRMQTFWVVMLCHWASASCCAQGTYCLRLQGQMAQELHFFLGQFDPQHEGLLIL